ncbi:MAG: hypothetical protein COZ06_14600 [Armatimonadetes bacterium CG_4_10_14_3_um_filter_66_18]|nr:hypothetical protein [Armatimonadota bacterium]OIP09712.1 MAG: hypothetical protein AUJ96_04800 [Armatimonadetes bacterium CG2_30_66_41]PIU93647.1 MAG: hypothetical protein COS65_11865 [Armatimonadetes bacterium CG06_land_8_20_14_3_00_66_21]PIX48094.1 MAG: hypothetical protein COZ57_06540 [Armatimonadetes bacterium CG_4_8_14_3_um_filter_66_20]PIY49274.1 MAG: hypothetical protein COZ06_14600 [Armatimonadetes bacterium CG_4_10_14_3_um_filter_66_18]PJB61589.1 MAG: hypothetical protein CO096_28
MAKCSYCGSTILFGGKKDEGLTFCNDKCLGKGVVVRLAQQLSEEEVRQEVMTVYRGKCAKCDGYGPIDVHVSHRVWSALFMTSWSSRPQVVCASCGTKGKVNDALFCLVLGWWGIPWGLIMTPIQIGRNIVGLFKTPAPSGPSEALTSVVRATMAAACLAEEEAKSQPGLHLQVPGR